MLLLMMMLDDVGVFHQNAVLCVPFSSSSEDFKFWWVGDDIHNNRYMMDVGGCGCGGGLVGWLVDG